MPSQDASARGDLIETAVQHEMTPLQEQLSASEGALDSGLCGQLEHDLLVWPREHLEPYLSSDSTGRVPLNEAHLQGMLESAFERSEELLRSAIQPALTDSGVYVGTVIWKGQELLLQRVSASNAIVHSTGLLNETPQIGELVRIAYSNGIGPVDEVALQRPSRELGL
jgi:hypothetical protein